MAAGGEAQGFKDFERDWWHRQAPNYDDRAGRMTRRAVGPLLDAVGARPGMRLLDVCSGPGYAAGEAAARGSAAMGVDLAPAMVEESRRRFPGVEFRAGDAEALPFPDASFDAAVCAFGLLHVPEPARAMAEAFRVLRPGGRYAFTVWAGPERAEFLGLGLGAMAAHAGAEAGAALPPGPPIFLLADRAFAARALETAGFGGVVSAEVPIAFRAPRPEDAWDWFEKSTVRTVAAYRLQAPEVQARVREAVVEGARRFAHGADGVSIPSPAVLYAGTKPPAA